MEREKDGEGADLLELGESILCLKFRAQNCELCK